MVAKVVGIRRNIDFTSQDGRPIKGNKLYVVYDDVHVVGQATHSVFCREEIDVSHVLVGESYNFLYETNFSGKSRLIEVVPAE